MPPLLLHYAVIFVCVLFIMLSFLCFLYSILIQVYKSDVNSSEN